MPRRATPKTAEAEIRGVIKWADRQGYINIAAALRRALVFMEEEKNK